MNSCALIGNLVRDAELRYTGSGTAVSNITIAINKKFKEEERTSYIDCVLWGRYAEAMNPFLTKGKKVGLLGELNQKKYEKDGETKYSLEVTVKDIDLLSPKSEAIGE